MTEAPQKISIIILRDEVRSFGERAIMDFNGDLLTHCRKTYLRAFLSRITGMALSIASLMPKMLSAKHFNNQGIRYLRRWDEQIVMANPVWLFAIC